MIVAILSVVSMLLAVLLGFTFFKKNSKAEKKLDFAIAIMKAGIDSLIPKLADKKITAEEAGDFVEDLVKKAKELL